MQRNLIKDLLEQAPLRRNLMVLARVSRVEPRSTQVLLWLNDESCEQDLRCVVNISRSCFEYAKKLRRGDLVEARAGLVVSSAQTELLDLVAYGVASIKSLAEPACADGRSWVPSSSFRDADERSAEYKRENNWRYRKTT